MGYFEFKNGIDGKTPLNADNLMAMQKGLLELVFPIGATYITQTNVDPNELLGFGTWERTKGKVFVGLDEDDTAFNTIGKTGGEKEHQLTTNEVPINNFGTTTQQSGGATDGFIMVGSYNRSGDRNLGGQGAAHNNLQPYEVAGYMWIRRA